MTDRDSLFFHENTKKNEMALMKRKNKNYHKKEREKKSRGDALPASVALKKLHRFGGKKEFFIISSFG